MNDSFWMGMAIEHARKGGRNVSPNPQVGAVIVQDGRIIGEAYHAKYGGPHAEKGAIDDARLRTGQQKFPNAILYCTLEPCCYRSPQKHQPPCTEAIIEAGIRHVVIAHHDPNPMVSGRGVAALRAAGCRVRLDVCKEEAMELNPGFITRMQTGRPFVTLKIAQSLDGRIAASSGDSKWITGEKAREQGHRLRAEHDAVLVGAGTVVSDNPRLTVRMCEGPDPMRIVMDSRLRTPENSHVIAPDTVFFCGRSASSDRIEAFRQRGAKVMVHNAENRYPLSEMLETLGAMAVNSVLVEGGSEIFTAFIRGKLCNRLELFTAPVIIGAGVNSINDLGAETIAGITRPHGFSWHDLGEGNMRFSAAMEVEPCLRD